MRTYVVALLMVPVPGVANAPPSAPGIAITPLDPTSTEDLVCLVAQESVDPDGDDVSYAFEWMVDGQVFTGMSVGSDQSWIDDNDLQSGETWACRVTPTDSIDQGDPSVISTVIAEGTWFQEETGYAGIEGSTSTWGCSWGDANADGYPDVYLTAHKMQPALWINQQNGTFQQASHLEVNGTDYDAHGAAWADVDNNGTQDLFEHVGAVGGTGSDANRFYYNHGVVLRDHAEALHIDYPEGRGRTPVWLDWNADGYLDIALLNQQRAGMPSRVRLQGAQQFINGPVLTDETVYWGTLTDLSGDAYLDLALFSFTFPPMHFEGSATGFVPATALTGDGTNGLADVAMADFDNDLDVDAFVSRRGPYESDMAQLDDQNLKLALYGSSVKGVSFQAVGDLTIVVDPPQSWETSLVLVGAAGVEMTSQEFDLSSQRLMARGMPTLPPGVADYILIGFDPVSEVWRIQSRTDSAGRYIAVTAHSGLSDPRALGFEPPDMTSVDYRNLHHDVYMMRDGTEFVDESGAAGLMDIGTSCWGAAAGDFDNDMDIDVYMVCSDSLLNLPNVLYENDGQGHFTRHVGAMGAAGSEDGQGDNVCIADVDLDGYLDLFVVNGKRLGRGPHQLFRNVRSGHHWVELDLIGTTSNRDGIGARVYVTAGGVTQLREQGGGMHFASQNHQRIHVGLGDHEIVDEVEIHWPSGVVDQFEDLSVDQVWELVEGSS